METAVFIQHAPTGVAAEASERRSQLENRSAALFRLRVNLAVEVRSATEIGQQPSGLWRSRTRGGKLFINPEHDDFPPLLAEALDRIAGHAWDAKAAAEALGCSTSQLVKFLRKEPRALALVNARRAERSLAALK